MTDSSELVSYIAGLKSDVKKAEQKARFFKSQHTKYRGRTPDVASSHQLMMKLEDDKVRALKGLLKKAEKILKQRSDGKPGPVKMPNKF